jgi:hypothetical protein
MKTTLWIMGLLIVSFTYTNCSSQFEFEAKSIGEVTVDKPLPGDEGPSDLEVPCDPATEVCVTLCHVPPGNPEARHTISVGEPAVDAHLSNHDMGEDSHDFLGACEDTSTTASLDAYGRGDP